MEPALDVLLLGFVLMRSGLLTGVAMGCVAAFLFLSPLTLDTSVWFWPRAAIVMLVVVLGAAWSARIAVGNHLLES
jgi:multisubunit Na+/H+ antiporter MnhE subunit